MDQIWSLQVSEELIDHPDVKVHGELFHGSLEEQVLGQGQVGVQVVDQVVDLVRHEEGISGALKDQLSCLAIELPGPIKFLYQCLLFMTMIKNNFRHE